MSGLRSIGIPLSAALSSWFIASCFPLEFSRINPQMMAKDIHAHEIAIDFEPTAPPLCTEAAATMIRSPITIEFPATLGETCAWGEGENASEGEFGIAASAFRLQQAVIAVPKNHQVCGLDVTHLLTRGERYNDTLTFTLNGYYLASSHFSKETIAAASQQSLHQPIRLAPHQLIGLRSGKFMNCAVGTDCNIPRSHRVGELSLRVSSQYLNGLAGTVASLQDLQFGLIVTGKRGVVDCQHSGLTLKGHLYSYPSKTGLTQAR